MSFSYQIRRSHRAKRARIVVTPSKVEIVAPLRMAESVIHRFVQNKQSWVIQTMGKLRHRAQMLESFAPVEYVQDAMIPFRGEKIPLTIASTKLKKIKIEFDSRFKALIPITYQDTDYQDAIRDSFIRWMKRRALIEAEIYVQRYAEKMRLFPRSVRIKNQKSRWGSCGINDDINLNWLLMLAPPEVFEYVVVHELCHIQVKNHSPEFWKLVAIYLPNYKQHRVWLKTHGASLMMGL